MADSSRTYRAGKLVLDLQRQQVLVDGRPIALARKNFEVLRELIIAEGRIIPREDLTRAVWPDTVVEEATLRQNVYTLRALLRELDWQAEYVETIPKVGYRIAVPVEIIQDSETPPAPPLVERRSWRRPLWLAGVVVLVLAAAAVLARWPAPVNGATQARAAELIRQGWLILDERNPERFPAAQALFDDALSLDAHSAEAHAGKALLHALSGDEASALAEAQRVQALNPADGVPFAVRGFFQMMYHQQWTEAGRSFVALQDHGCPDPFCRQWYALYLGLTGQSAGALRAAAGAVESFPSRLAPRAAYGQMLYWAGNNDAAIRELETVVKTGGSATHARWHLWKAQWLAGNRREAFQNLLLSLEPSWQRLPTEDDFHVLAAQDDLDGTPASLERVLSIGRRNAINLYFLAEIAIAAGNTSEAANYLEQASSRRVFFTPYARRDPLFTPLHGTARYDTVMRKLGL